MEFIYPTNLLELLLAGTILGIIVMAIIQKVKLFSCVNSTCYILILNAVLSIGLGIPFFICFYRYDLLSGFWVGIISFAEAPTIYDLLKKQNIIGTKNSSENSDNEEN